MSTKEEAKPVINTKGAQSGRMKGSTGELKDAPKSVAGSRSAASYIDSLKNGGK